MNTPAGSAELKNDTPHYIALTSREGPIARDGGILFLTHEELPLNFKIYDASSDIICRMIEYI